MKYCLLCCLALFMAASGQAQTAAATPTVPAVEKQIQPKIIVIPRVKDGEDMKAYYDGDMNVQIALAKINEIFVNNNANIVQFAAYFNQQKLNAQLSGASGNQEDFKSMVLRMSGSDIYVEAKLDIVKHPGYNNANSVTVILEGYQNGTGNLLGSKTGHSRVNTTADVGILVGQAMDTVTTGFLNLMQKRFDDIRANGQSVYVELALGSNAKQDFDYEIPSKNKFLAEVIEDWVREHAVNGVANSQGVLDRKMIFSDVRIPLKNPANKTINYTGQNYKYDLIRFLKSLGVQAKSDFSTNNKILITIQ